MLGSRRRKVDGFAGQPRMILHSEVVRVSTSVLAPISLDALFNSLLAEQNIHTLSEGKLLGGLIS